MKVAALITSIFICAAALYVGSYFLFYREAIPEPFSPQRQFDSYFYPLQSMETKISKRRKVQKEFADLTGAWIEEQPPSDNEKLLNPAEIEIKGSQISILNSSETFPTKVGAYNIEIRNTLFIFSDDLKTTFDIRIGGDFIVIGWFDDGATIWRPFRRL